MIHNGRSVLCLGVFTLTKDEIGDQENRGGSTQGTQIERNYGPIIGIVVLVVCAGVFISGLFLMGAYISCSIGDGTLDGVRCIQMTEYGSCSLNGKQIFVTENGETREGVILEIQNCSPEWASP